MASTSNGNYDALPSPSSKRLALVMWRITLRPTNVPDGLFHDFSVILCGVRADNGDQWVCFMIRHFVYSMRLNHWQKDIQIQFKTTCWFTRIKPINFGCM
jgi:hypothetical protein